MAESGIPYYVCPGTSAWNALLGRTHNMTENIASAAKQGLAFNARGLLVTDWGDHGHHQYLPFSYPGLVNGASHSWNHKGSSSLNTGTAIDQIFYPDHEAGMGELLLLLGRATELVATPLRNATLFNRLLFWNMTAEPAEARQLSNATIMAACDQLRELKAMTTSLTGLDNLSLQEAGNACTMALVGLEKLLLFRGEGQSRRITERRTESAIAAHQQLWLARNRPGGLRESTAYLERSLRALQQ